MKKIIIILLTLSFFSCKKAITKNMRADAKRDSVIVNSTLPPDPGGDPDKSW